MKPINKGEINMKTFVKLTKNPITWIAFALACIIGAIVWVFTSKEQD